MTGKQPLQLLSGGAATAGESLRVHHFARVLGVAILLAVALACSSSTSTSSDSTAGFDALRGDVREWNRTAGPLVSAYLDESVSADEFVLIATPIVEDLEGVLDSMRSRDLSSMPPTLESLTKDLLVTYDNKLSAMNQLVVAVQIGDVDAELAAQENLERANAAAAVIGCDFVRASAEVDVGVDSSELAAALQANGC